MTLEEFRAKYPDLAKDIQAMDQRARWKLFEEWGGVCNCGGDGNWCCFDPRED